jgi:dTDP-4-dehydrorhamnose 3,5-epimerase
MPFKFRRLEIRDVLLVEPTVFSDDRGFFMETFRLSDFKKAGIEFSPVQENHSKSKRNVLRGLHYQSGPFVQAKLVRVIKGRIFDVAVDMRKSSPTFAKWVGVELSETNRLLLLIPRGFAHGFAALEDDTEVVYLVDNDYSKLCEQGVSWKDGKIGIRWPVNKPVVSEKDAKWPDLDHAVLFA